MGQLSGLGEDPKLFEPAKSPRQFWSEVLGEAKGSIGIENPIKEFVNASLWGQPLLVMPGIVSK